MENSTSLLANKQWVRRYANGLTAIGMSALVLSIVFGIISLFRGAELSWHAYAMYSLFFACGFLKSFLVVGLASFLTYALGARHKPGWILRLADKTLYVLAALEVSWFLLSYFPFLFRFHNSSVNVDATWGMGLTIGYQGLRSLVRAIVWGSLGLILRRVLPIIEESRTLV